MVDKFHFLFVFKLFFQSRQRVMYSIGNGRRALLSNAFVVFSLLLLSTQIQASPLLDIKFNEATGLTASDSSGLGHNARLENGVKWNSSSLAFDGVNDIARVRQAAALNLVDEFTIAVSVKTNEDRLSLQTRQREILYRKGSNIIFGYERDKVDQIDWLRFYIKYANGKDQEVELRDDGDANTRNNVWHHYVITFKKGEIFKLYVDGQLIDSERPKTNSSIRLSSKNNDWLLGGREKSSGTIDRNLRAEIDNFYINNRAFSDKEVLNFYQQTILTKPTGVVLNTSFERVNGRVVHETSGLNNNIQLHNASMVGTSNGHLTLNGVNDFARISESSSLNLVDAFTISLSFKTSENRINAATRQREILYRKGSNILFGFESGKEKNIIWLRFYIKYADNKLQEVELRDDGVKNLRNNTWHHYAITFERGGMFRLYINGVLMDEEKVKSNAKLRLSSSSNDWILGAREKKDGTIDRVISGDLDDLLIQNVALNAQQVSALVNGIAKPFGQLEVAITGRPSTSVKSNATYRFVPKASGGGARHTFKIDNKPVWATFNTRTGELSGKPGKSHVGVYKNIKISVSANRSSASLPPFNLTVLDVKTNVKIRLTGVNDGEQRYVGNVTVGASISELAKVSSVAFSRDGSTWYPDPDGKAPWHYDFGTLGPGQYSIQAKATTLDGTESRSSIAKLQITLAKPTLTITNGLTPTYFNVSWSPVAGATSYQLEESVNSGAFTPVATLSATSKRFTNKPEGNYRYQVKACVGNVCSRYSTSKNIVVSLVVGQCSI